MKKSNLCLSLTAVSLALLGAQQLPAVTVLTNSLGALGTSTTTTGSLANQGTALEESFTLTAAAKLTIFTDSYGGGLNSNGSTAISGGFMPSLVLYSSTGNYVAGETFPSPIGKADASSGLVGDAYLTVGTLAAGNYILALSDFQVQQSATAKSLSDGFINYGSGTSFLDVQGNLRTGNYSLNFSATPVVSPNAAPEPATFLLVVPALGAAALLRRRRNSVA